MTNEAYARVKIDALLGAQGWNPQDTTAVRYEVVLPDGTRADYVLCDRHGRSLAVIEAKRFSAIVPKRRQANTASTPKVLGSLPILVPPIDLQTKFKGKADGVKSIMSQQVNALAKAQATFNALLAQAFSPPTSSVSPQE